MHTLFNSEFKNKMENIIKTVSEYVKFYVQENYIVVNDRLNRNDICECRRGREDDKHFCMK